MGALSARQALGPVGTAAVYGQGPMFFTGQTGPARRVDLRGRSRQEESREQVLERTRAERERRQRDKLEARSALLLQAAWRRHAAARALANLLRKEWDERFGSSTCIPDIGRCELC